MVIISVFCLEYDSASVFFSSHPTQISPVQISKDVMLLHSVSGTEDYITLLHFIIPRGNLFAEGTYTIYTATTDKQADNQTEDSLQR